MSKVLKALFSPIKLLIIAAVVVAFGVATGRVLPKVDAAQTNNIVSCDTVDGQCPETCKSLDGEFIVSIPIPAGQHANSDGFCTPDPDLCPNIDGSQTTVPTGFHVDDKSGDCVADSTPQVLGESTTVNDPGPQVLAESFGK